MLLSLLLSVFGFIKSDEFDFAFWGALIIAIFIITISAPVSGVRFELQLLTLTFLVFALLVKLVLSRLEKNTTLSNNSICIRPFIGQILGLFTIFAYVYGAGGVTGIGRSWIDIATNRSTLELLATNASQILFILALTVFLFLYIKEEKIKYFFFAVILGLLFLALTRVKAYLLPILLPYVFLTYKNNKNKPLKLIFKGLIFLFMVIFLYIGTTTVRWLGSAENIDFNKLQETTQVATQSGVERNLSHQFSSIFDYYLHNDFLYGQTYLTFLNPLLKIINEEPIENPMYIYSNILHGESSKMKGSVHPTVIVDSYANFGFFAVFVGGLILFFLSVIYKRLVKGKVFRYSLFLVVSSYSIPMLIRGSVYYGCLYFILLLTIGIFSEKFISIKSGNK